MNTRATNVDLTSAPAYQLADGWPENLPERSDEFFVVAAGLCAGERPDVAARFEEFADVFRTPAEREKHRLAQRDELIRQTAAQFYPRTLWRRELARIIANDLVDLDPERDDDPPPRRQNMALREVIELNGDRIEGLGFETLRKVLSRRG